MMPALIRQEEPSPQNNDWAQTLMEIKDLASVMVFYLATVVIEVEVWFKRSRFSTYSQGASSS